MPRSDPFDDTRRSHRPHPAAPFSLLPALAALLLLGCAGAPPGEGGAAPDAGAAAGAAAAEAERPAMTRLESNDGSYLVLYRPLPDPIPDNELFALEVRIFDARRGQAAVTDIELAVDAAMPEHAHGMNVQPRVRKNNDGSYVATGMLFHMPGRWELYFDITRGGVSERAQTEIWMD